MASNPLPFTWPQFERETGRELPPSARQRLTDCAARPDTRTWAAARTIIVAPKLSMIGQTLWQCAEAITLTRIPDGQVPSQRTIILALCYAAGIPAPAAVRR